MANGPSETVLCVPREVAERFSKPGFTPSGNACLSRLLDPSRLTSRDRSEVDPDKAAGLGGREDFLQICTYTVMKVGPVGESRVLVYGRGGGGGEAQLYERFSVGVGGHVGPDEMDPEAIVPARAFFGAAIRELREELSISSTLTSINLAGVVRYDGDAVGRRHLGLVFLAGFDGELVRAKEETAILRPAYFRPATIRELWWKSLEPWSQIVLDALYPDEVKVG